MPAIELDHLSKRFDGAATALDRVSLSIADGELLSVVGPSGSGKTTLLRLIAGLESPTSGEIRFDGRSMTGVPPWKRRVGFAFQHPALIPHQSVRRQFQVQGGLIEQVAGSQNDHIYQILQISHLLDRFPEQLSGGERQRVALAAAMVGQPEVILLDEPLSHLDSGQRNELRRKIKRLHQHLKRTTVYVTHDQSEALSLGQRVAVLDAGRLLQVDEPATVYHQPATRFVASFLGSPPMNLVAGQWSAAIAGAKFSAFGACWVVDNWPLNGVQRCIPNSVLWGQRAESLRLGAETPDAVPVERSTSDQPPALSVRVVEVDVYPDVAWIYVAPANDAAGPNQPWIVKIAGESGWRPGDRCRMTWNWANACWFDANTGERISRSPTSNSDNSTT